MDWLVDIQGRGVDVERPPQDDRFGNANIFPSQELPVDYALVSSSLCLVIGMSSGLQQRLCVLYHRHLLPPFLKTGS